MIWAAVVAISESRAKHRDDDKAYRNLSSSELT